MAVSAADRGAGALRPRTRAGRALLPAAWIAVIAAALWLVIGHGFANYDTFYPLVWGKQLVHGHSPDYGAPIPPTPHPLADLAGAALSPLGDTAEDVLVAIGYLCLGAIGYLVYRLGAIWFGPAIGVVAAVIALSREPMLSDGVRAYVDIPFVALALAALLVETKRPRAGAPVLALLAVAGLLRPEAWLFSAAYLAYVALERDPGRGRWALRRRAAIDRRGLAALAALAASTPVAWALFDLITAGDPLYSFTGTRDTVGTLNRQTGVVDLVLYGPRRLGEIMREPGLMGAAGGVVLCFAFLRRRSPLGIAAAALALGAFALLAIGGLAVITRYLLLAATVLAVFCAAGLLGWRLLAADHPWRRRWQAFAALTALLFVALLPHQVDLISDLRGSIATQQRIRDDLHSLVDAGAFGGHCGPISVPNHRPLPLLALWLDRRPSRIVSSSEQRQPDRGYFLDPASAFVERNFTLDPNDPRRLTAAVPPGFRLRAQNRSWKLYVRCKRTVHPPS